MPARTASVGSTARTRTEPFASIDVADRKRGQGLEYGAASFTIPVGAGVDLDYGDSEITWKIKLHGDIAYWPDVNEEYEITVIEADEEDSGDS